MSVRQAQHSATWTTLRCIEFWSHSLLYVYVIWAYETFLLFVGVYHISAGNAQRKQHACMSSLREAPHASLPRILWLPLPAKNRWSLHARATPTVGFREVETTVFDPASVFLSTHWWSQKPSLPVLYLCTIKKLPPQPASFYNPLETVTVTVAPHCTQKKKRRIFFVRGPTLYHKFCTSKLKKRRTASCASPVPLQPPAPCPRPRRPPARRLDGPSCLGRQGQAGMVPGKGAWAQPQRAWSCACSHSQFFCGIQQVVDSWRQEEENYSTLSCGAWADKQDIWWEEVVGGDCEGSVGLQSERDLLC